MHGRIAIKEDGLGPQFLENSPEGRLSGGDSAGEREAVHLHLSSQEQILK